MFGSSGTTFGFGQQQQQQQQQPQQPAAGGLFGGTSGGFGSTFGATATPAFGQPAQQQQPTSGFGGLGGTSSAPAFGSTASAAPAFGQPAQQQGGGLFGSANTAAPSTSFSFGASNAGATSTFGQPATGASGGLFGAPKPATTGFGGFGQPAQPQQPAATGGLFGAASTTPGFGAAAPAGPANGTAVAPYQPTTVMEPPAEEGKPPPTNQTAHQFQSITCMPQYKNYSFEELRFQDYQANRKQPTAGATPAFGSAFGASSTPAFGAAAPATGGGLFGASSTTTPAFGAASGATNAFGSAPSSGGLFGSSGSAGAFGQPATSQPAAGGGLFGQAASQPAQTGGLFGASSGTSTFGQPAATSAPAFGGFGAAAAPKPATTGFSFGASNTTPASTGGLFGSSTPATSTAPSNPFGQPAQPAATGGGLFGQTQPAASAAPSFSFGAPAANKPLFGGSAPTSAPAFGQPAAATAPKPAFSFGAPAAGSTGGGLFGNSQPQTSAASAFGAPPAQQQQPTGGGLFGGGSTFGQPAAQPQAGQGTSAFGGGLFGAKPAQPATGGGLFGSSAAPATGGGLFGSMQQQQQPAQPQQSTGLFGSLSQPAPQLGGSLFGGSLNQSGQPPQQAPQQQAAYASADDANAYGSNPLFASVGQSPVRPAEDKKKPPIFTAFRGTPVSRSSTKITRLRGFGTGSTGSPAPGAGLGASIGLGSSTASGLGGGYGLGGSTATPGTPAGRGSPLRLVNGISDEVALSPNAFVSRPSVKKLVIDKKSLGRSLAGSASAAPADGAAPRAAKVSFNPTVQVPGRFSNGSSSVASLRDSVAGEALGAAGGGDGDASFVSEAGLTEGNTTLDSPSAARSVAAELPSRGRTTQAQQSQQLQDGDYYTLPAIETLQKLPAAKLRSVPDLVVGRVGYGKVAFNRPVDLTTLPSVDELLGGLVRLEDRNATVYPDEWDAVKPPPGQGLNVPATITLEHCFPLDKATRKPIRDKDHPRVAQHIKRLRSLADTQFVDYDAATGTWAFETTEF